MKTVIQSKVCTICRQDKPLAEFPRDRRTKDGLRCQCRVCKNSSAAGYYKNWTPEQRLLHRRRVTRSRYGIEYDLVVSLFEQQEGCCKICSKQGDVPIGHEQQHDRKRALQIDHNHETGEIRGLLCRECNLGLGKFRDSPQRLIRAVVYLMEGGASPSL